MSIPHESLFRSLPKLLTSSNCSASGDSPSLAVATTHCNVQRKGELQHLYLQEMGLQAQLIDDFYVNLRKKCNYKNVMVHSGCDLGRINFMVHMNGTNSKAEVRLSTRTIALTTPL